MSLLIFFSNDFLNQKCVQSKFHNVWLVWAPKKCPAKTNSQIFDIQVCLKKSFNLQYLTFLKYQPCSVRAYLLQLLEYFAFTLWHLAFFVEYSHHVKINENFAMLKNSTCKNVLRKKENESWYDRNDFLL